MTFGNSTYRCGNYSKEESIWGNTVCHEASKSFWKNIIHLKGIQDKNCVAQFLIGYFCITFCKKKSAAKSNEKLVNRKYVTLFLSWIPFKKFVQWFLALKDYVDHLAPGFWDLGSFLDSSWGWQLKFSAKV